MSHYFCTFMLCGALLKIRVDTDVEGRLEKVCDALEKKLDATFLYAEQVVPETTFD
jgi:hypothetical protein